MVHQGLLIGCYKKLVTYKDAEVCLTVLHVMSEVKSQ